MRQADGTGSRDAHVEPLQDGSLEARASVALKILALINLGGVVLALFPPDVPVATLQALAFNLAACALAAIELVEARALDRRRPWAVAAVRPLLLLLFGMGIASLLLGLQDGWIRLPYESVIAAWALLGAADTTLTPRTSGRALALTGAALLVMVSMLVGEPVFGWGGVLDVRPSDLRASIDVDCGSPGADPPETVTVTYDWSWARPGLVSSGLDIVVLGWTMGDDAGRPVYLFDKDPPTSRGIYSGLRDHPSLDLAAQVEQESQSSWDWGVDLGEQALQPGKVELVLRRVRDAPTGREPLAVTATYVHLGTWRSEPVSVTCSW
jgi:hypothetical protein